MNSVLCPIGFGMHNRSITCQNKIAIDLLPKYATGKVVQWSPQEQVLAHPSVACFVTHCGWNSTMESLTSGMPVVAFPQWGDQVTDAVYLVDVFKTGVRMCRGEAENRVIPREEVEKCLLEAISGPKAEEMKKNALKWKEVAEAAVAEGGSSDRNLQEFVDEVGRRSVGVTTYNSAPAKIVEVVDSALPALGVRI